MVWVVGPVTCVGILDGSFNLTKRKFDGLGWIEGCSHLGIVVLNVNGRNDAVGGIEVMKDFHGGDVVVAGVAIAKTSDVSFVKGFDKLLLENFAGGVVFSPDAKVFFVLSDRFIDLCGCASCFDVGCCPRVNGSIKGSVG